MSRALALVWCLFTAGAGEAESGTVAGKVEVRRGPGLTEVSEVVVYVVGYDEDPHPEPAQIRQRDKKFLPELVPITAGQSVVFPNDDPFFHNVFSPSPGGKFDLGQYKQGDQKTKLFKNAGVVDVFCNIHPEMAATILVLPNKSFTRAAADGAFRLEKVRAGRWRLYAYSRRAIAPVSAPIDVQPNKTVEVSLAIDEVVKDLAHLNKYGEKYRDPEKYRAP